MLITSTLLLSSNSQEVMAKKKRASSLANSLEHESKVPPILEISYTEPLFSVASHPTKPIVVSGLATGHLYSYSYNAEQLEDRVKLAKEQYVTHEKGKALISQLKKKWWTVESDHTKISGRDGVSTNWKTKRHQGSCRSVIFDVSDNSPGEYIYSVGTDHVIKKAYTESGKVASKAQISDHYSDAKDAITTLAACSSHPLLLAGTENGDVLVFNSKDLSSGKVMYKLSNMHEDAMTKILPMPAVSAYHYLTLGSTTLSHIDIRKGIITQSDDQSDELLSMCYATDSVSGNKNDTVLVSHGEGIVTLWRNSTNRFMDQISRIKVNKNASIDAIMPTMNAGDEDMADSVWCGDSEGLLHRINYKKGRVVETRVHSSSVGKLGGVDEVNGLEIDYDYRLVSSGMEGLKIWSDSTQQDEELAEAESDSSDDDDDDDEDDDSIDEFDSSSVEISSADEEAHAEDDDSSGEKDESDDIDQTPTTEIVKRSRRDFTKVVTKPRKTKIDINKLTRATSPQEEETPKKKQKVVKQSKPNNGITKFEGL